MSKASECESDQALATEFIAQIRAAHAASPLADPSTATLPSEPQIWDISLTYGELPASTFLQVLSLSLPYLTAAPPHSFYDFGSGQGLPPLLASVFLPSTFTSFAGTEVSPTHHAAALSHRAHAAALAPAALPGRPGAAAALLGVQLHWEDGLSPPLLPLLHSASLLYMNSTAFSEALLGEVLKEAECLARGALLVCTSQLVRSVLFELVAEAVLPSSWGQATVRVYRRNRMPRWAVGMTKGGSRSGRPEEGAAAAALHQSQQAGGEKS